MPQATLHGNTPIDHVVDHGNSKEVSFTHATDNGHMMVFTIVAQYANGAPVDIDIDLALTDIVSRHVGEDFAPEDIASRICQPAS